MNHLRTQITAWLALFLLALAFPVSASLRAPHDLAQSPAPRATAWTSGPGQTLTASYADAAARLALGSDRFGFSSEQYDADLGLIYFNHRYYNPETGKWLSPDPIAEQGGLNLYGFCGNDGINGFDYLGLESWWWEDAYVALSSWDNFKSVSGAGYDGFVEGSAGVSDVLTIGLAKKARNNYTTALLGDPCFNDDLYASDGYAFGTKAGGVARSAIIGAATGGLLGQLNALAASGNTLALYTNAGLTSYFVVTGTQSAATNAAYATTAFEQGDYKAGLLYSGGAALDAVGPALAARQAFTSTKGMIGSYENSTVTGSVVDDVGLIRTRLQRLGYDETNTARIMGAVKNGEQVVVVGENMKRVNAVARMVDRAGGQPVTYTPRNWTGVNKNTLEANRSWIRYWGKDVGATVIDIGRQPTPRAFGPSPSYGIENRSLNNWGIYTPFNE